MGKSKSQTTGYWYPTIFQHGIGLTCDALLAMRGGSKTAWEGEVTANTTINVNAPNLFGGEKDQGGIVGPLEVMFGGPMQAPSAYLTANLEATTAADYNDYGGAGDGLNPSPTPTPVARVSAWRGFTTVVGQGMRLGANNPYPQKLSYKIRRITAAMAEVGDWYPEKAAVVVKLGEVLTEDLSFPATSASIGPYAGVKYDGLSPSDTIVVQSIQGGTYQAWSAWLSDGEPGAAGLPWSSGFWVTNGEEVTEHFWPDWYPSAASAHAAVAGKQIVLSGSTEYTFWLQDTPVSDNRGGLSLKIFKAGLIAINPAHWLYYLHAHPEVGREPTGNFNDASWRAAADELYDEGFGICVEYDPDKESLEEHTQRIGKLIGGSVNRGLDGQLYLDLARGKYNIDDLPILTDDDVLDFRELPSILDGAVNSVSVKYFDPERKENIVTPADVDLALVDAFGLVHQVNEYLEIPEASLAGRKARSDRQATTTPTRAFELATKTKPFGWRPNTYFRARLVKRGIADMVCLLAEKQSGTLKSGALRLTATQDIYNLPDASFVEVEPGGSTASTPTPTPLTLQHAYEAPYTEAAQRISRAELAALPPDVGYLQAVAADLAGQRDYTMMVADAGGEYVEAGSSAWCPVAQTAEAYGRTDTVLQLRSAVGLAEVAIGSAGEWDGEIVRVDDKDEEAGTLTVGRACADTTPARHAAGSRIWFYDNGAAVDATEYTAGESVDVKLLSNTTTAQLDLVDATAMTVEFDQRIARPYPPAKLRLNDEADPSYLFGEIVATWVHRDRIGQADQLVDTEAATIGPEAGTTYTVRWYLNGVLELTDAGIAGTSSSYTPAGGGLVRVEAEAVRDGLTSWQMQVREFYTSDPLLDQLGNAITDQSDQPIFMG